MVSPVALLASGPTLAAEEAAAPVYLDGLTVEAAELRVSAGKVEASVIDTPQAISVITSEQFLERGAQTLQETLRYTAGVSAEAYGNDGRDDYSLVRGVEAPIYLDGLRRTVGFYIPRTDIHMLEQVEVLKGPGGSLYGAGSIGGLINQTSKRPRFEAGGEASIAYGSFDRFEATLDLTGPLDADGTLAGRIVAVLRESGTQTDFVDDDRVLIAPSLTWKPGEDTTITLLGRFQQDRGGTISTFVPSAASYLAEPGRRLPTSRFLSEPDFEKYDTDTLSLGVQAEHRFGETLVVRSNSRYLDAKLDYQTIYPDSYTNPAQPFIDPDRRVLDRYIFAIDPHSRTFTSDNHLQADFATGPLEHRLLAGADYRHFRQTSSSLSGLTTPIDAYAPVYGNYSVPDRLRDPDERQSQFGIYLQDEVRYGPVAVLAGVRRDRARSKIEGSPAQVDRATTYRAAVMIDLDHGLSPYLSYTQSFLPITGTDAAGQTFDPSRGRQWEGGLKWQVTRDSLVTLAAYEIVERNRLTRDPVNPLFSVQTGEVRLRGLEAEANVRVSGFDVTAAVTFADTEISESNDLAEVGDPLEGAPERQASLFAARTFALTQDLNLRLGAGVRYVGESYSGDLRTPGFTLADAYAALGWDQWLLSVNATNLTDKRYYSTCLTRGDCFLGVRRSVVATLRRQF